MDLRHSIRQQRQLLHPVTHLVYRRSRVMDRAISLQHYRHSEVSGDRPHLPKVKWCSRCLWYCGLRCVGWETGGTCYCLRGNNHEFATPFWSGKTCQEIWNKSGPCLSSFRRSIVKTSPPTQFKYAFNERVKPGELPPHRRQSAVASILVTIVSS